MLILALSHSHGGYSGLSAVFGRLLSDLYGAGVAVFKD
jgi:hypothetical protein